MKYRDLINKIEKGARFSVDFKKRELKINGKDFDITGFDFSKAIITGDILSDLWILYYEYKHSVPSERSENHRRCYFKALPEKELTDDEMMYGTPREVARFMLETELLYYIKTGLLKWDDETMGTWFWQSPYDKDFVILKEWVMG